MTKIVHLCLPGVVLFLHVTHCFTISPGLALAWSLSFPTLRISSWLERESDVLWCKGHTIRAENPGQRYEGICSVIESEKLHSETTEVFVASEAKRSPLTQSPAMRADVKIA